MPAGPDKPWLSEFLSPRKGAGPPRIARQGQHRLLNGPLTRGCTVAKWAGWEGEWLRRPAQAEMNVC
jgi:hypothetical protein